MNILVLTPYVAWPLDHGGRIRTHHLLRALAQDHRVVNLAVARAPRDRDDAEALQTIGVTVRPGLIPEPDMRPPARKLGKWISIACGKSSLPGRWRNAGFGALVRETTSRISFDLAVIETPWMDVYRPLFRTLPFVASSQNVESDILLDVASRDSGMRRVIGERDARLFLRREAAFFGEAAAAIAVSENDAARIRALAPSARVSVVENGIDTNRILLLPPPEPGGPILFVGSFDYAANVEAAKWFVTDVLPAIRKTLGHATLILAGRNPPPTVMALGRMAGVEIAANAPDLQPLYARARAVVVPIRTGGGTRIKILEAFAFGRPVITTAAGMRGLALRDGTHVLAAETAEDFASALARLRAEPGLADRLVQAGRAFVEARHAWPALERRFADVVAGAARTAP
jgi:glycosyltransferase involved in cell wall biosynthesis